MKIKNLIIHITIGLALLSSCVSNKKFILLQNAKTSSATDSSKSNYLLDRTIYKLQVNDILYVSVASTDEVISKTFSHSVGSMQLMQMQGGLGSMLYLIGYSIDSKGVINLPVIGKLRVVGLSINEAKEVIDVELRKYFKVFHLVVQLTEMPFTVLGEVQRTGRYSGLLNQVTIMEALALAGDFTTIANRRNVTIIRQSVSEFTRYRNPTF